MFRNVCILKHYWIVFPKHYFPACPKYFFPAIPKTEFFSLFDRYLNGLLFCLILYFICIVLIFRGCLVEEGVKLNLGWLGKSFIELKQGITWQVLHKKNYSPVCQMEFYVIVLWNLRWVESSLTGLNCFRKVKCKNAIRTPLHFLNSASKSSKSQRWISRANNKLLIEAVTLLEEAAPIKWFGGDFFLFVHSRFWQTMV